MSDSDVTPRVAPEEDATACPEQAEVGLSDVPHSKQSESLPKANPAPSAGSMLPLLLAVWACWFLAMGLAHYILRDGTIVYASATILALTLSLVAIFNTLTRNA